MDRIVMMGRISPGRRRGPAGLLMALFVVAGLVFSYGLGHGPPREVCTAHLMGVPAGAAAAAESAAQALGDAAASPAAAFSALSAVKAPAAPFPPGPADAACLCLAVLLGLIALALAARARGPGRLLPRRTGRAAPPSARPASRRPSLASLQVLRL